MPTTPFQELVQGFRGANWSPTRTAYAADGRSWQMDLAWKAYEGKLAAPLRVKSGQPDDNVYANVSRGVVDKGVSFLFGRGLTWNLDGAQERSGDEKYLDAVWEHNNKPVVLHRLATNGGIYGQAFLKIHPQEPFPRLIVLDPSKVTVETADDDYTFVLRFVVCWRGVDKSGRKETVKEYRQVVERRPATEESLATGVSTTPEHWRILDQEREVTSFGPDFPADESAWTTTRTDVWNYPFPPIVSAQNLPAPNAYWGVSDLEPDAVRLNEAMNRVLSNINKIIRLHAHPKTWSKGLTPEQQVQIRIDPEGMIHLPSDLASLQNLEMRSDLASSIAHYQKLREAHYELTRVPQVSSGTVEDLQYLSAMAMQTLYGPLIEKTETKKATYGRLIREVAFCLLALSGREGRFPSLVWPEILPRDAQVESQTAEIDLRVGFSKDTLIARLGGDPVYERRQRRLDLMEEVEREKLLAQAKGAGQPTKGPDGTTTPPDEPVVAMPSPTANDDRQARMRPNRPIQ